MKLIVAGSTGFVGTEVVRQALSHPAVTSVVALARRATPVPPDVNASKLKSTICEDFEHYSDSVKADLAGADACIWYYYPPRPFDKICLLSSEQAHSYNAIQTVQNAL